MEGLEIGIEEIVQMLALAFTLLTIGSAIFIMGDPSKLNAQATAHELSYIATLSTNNNILVEISYDENTKISENNNKITVQYKTATATKNYFGEQINIKQETNGVYTISS